MKTVLNSARAAAVLLTLTGCGQKGPLYLPDHASDVITRPTQTSTPAPAPAPQPAAAPADDDEKDKDQKGNGKDSVAAPK